MLEGLRQAQEGVRISLRRLVVTLGDQLDPASAAFDGFRRTSTWRFETGTPGFPPDLLTEREAWLPRPGRPETDAALLSVFGEGNISTEALMFQSGHLTIDEEQ